MKKLQDPKCEIVNAIRKQRPMSRKLCLTCKGGRLLCGRPSCPLLSKINIQSPFEGKLKESVFGPSPSIFVGWNGYPQVSIGPMTSLEPEDAALLDDPGRWYGLDFSDIIRFRSMLVRSKSRQSVREKTALVEKAQEIALSVNPVDTEVLFYSRPKYSISFSPISQPMGPSANLKDLDITENPKIPRKVDALVSDELSASDSSNALYKSGYDVYYLSGVLSSGALGLDERKKLVPTRWSITAVDDIIGKGLIEKIKNYSEISEHRVYSNTYLENHFEILLIPIQWEFEQFEAWAPDTLWTMAYSDYAINQESERYRGRRDYALKEGGGYYAGRLGVLEGLERLRRQACAIIFREIYEGYIVPVGVWEVRENVRQAFKNPPRKFDTLNEALTDIGTRLKIPVEEYLRRSEILSQRRIDEY
ncbi:MAG: Nre family DNA repair protein [Candidatus Hydrothermarchaeaceae archaeon]